MPRPGPRPYECIRRAWHSESHQALRGSLTQEIFRIVTELHSPETRSKKEWQEKLPIVVLRAEEILYSKARTQLEYTDASTLKSRLEDAVNTMIRRTDDNKEEESGAFMEPCVEAALSLGCIPKMNPRGQRSCPARLSGNSVRRSSSSQPSSMTSITSNPPAATHTQPGHDSLPFPSREWTVPAQLMVEPMRPNVVNPPYINPGGTPGFEQQQHVQLSAQLPFNFRLRDRSLAPPTPVFTTEEYNFHHPVVFQHANRLLPSMFPSRVEAPLRNTSTSSKMSKGLACETDDDLELSLGLRKMNNGGVHLELSGSSSSSGSSMSWQSEGGQDCSKRKALACTFSGGAQLEVTKRQRDYPFY